MVVVPWSVLSCNSYTGEREVTGSKENIDNIDILLKYFTPYSFKGLEN